MYTILLAAACSVSTDSYGGKPDGDAQDQDPASGGDDTGTETVGEIETGDPIDTATPDDDGWPHVDAAWAAALYDPRVVKHVELTVPAASEDALRRDPRTWAEADMVLEGEAMSRVAIRIKGSSSFRSWDDKPSIKIKTDEFVPDQELHGFERFTLNNMIEDPAQGREVLAYYLWNAAGQAAPRCGYATLTVNGQPYGLYALLEPVDHAFLAQRYPTAGGALWAGNDSADLTPTGVSHFELKIGEDTGQLVAAANWLVTGEGPYYDVASGVLDMDQFLGFLTWSILTGFQDGYPYHKNDFFLYADASDEGRLDWMPWGMDESWDTGWIWQWGYRDTVGFDCAADSDCMARLEESVLDGIATFEAADPGALAAEVFAETEEAVLADPKRPYTPAEVEAARARLLGMADTWPSHVRTQMGLP